MKKDCDHIFTKGGICEDCGKKVLELETRPCGECSNIKSDIHGHFCTKKLMAVTSSMKVTFHVDEGTCFEPMENKNQITK